MAAIFEFPGTMAGHCFVSFGHNYTHKQVYDECVKGRDQLNDFIAQALQVMKQETPAPRDMKKVLFPIVRDFNCVVGPNLHWSDRQLFPADNKVVSIETTDIFTILVAAGAFESKGQARKNWTGIKELPTGWTELGPIGKAKLHIFIWNPSE